MKQRSSLISRVATAVCVGAGLWWLTKNQLRRQRRLNLAGRGVLITGGSRGLGLALARELVGCRCRIAICARNEKELATAAENLKSLGGEVHTFVCDLRDPVQISNMIEKADAALGGIDLLINNAATILVGPADHMTVEDFQQAMDINFWAAVRTTLAVTPKMKSRGGGRIVNIASVGGKMPVPHLSPYCASKFALVGFSGGMRTELARDRILVTTVCPGLMRTGSPRNAEFKGNAVAEYAWFSIGDSLPVMSMSARRAAKAIVRAAVDGDAEVILGLPAQIAARSYGLAPELHQLLSTLINRLLPGPGSSEKTLGRDSESWITRSIARCLGHAAEQDYNQIAPSVEHSQR